VRPPLRPDALRRPDLSRLDPGHPDRDEILRRHDRAVAAGDAMYADPATGLMVMTAATLAERGWCCDQGCRHCPYVGTTDKDAWRKWARAVRRSVDGHRAGALVREHLRPVVEAAGGRVLVYRAMAGEIDLDPLIADLGAERFALTHTPAAGQLTVHPAESPLERHRLGFEQPRADAPLLRLADLTRALVPGLAFDRRGNRIGHGLGYYDGLLAELPRRVPLIGVTSDAQVVPDLPHGPSDVPMTHLVTESGLRAVDR
jgi:5,10-methenyltetrahydrofolate synthetase